MTINAPSLTPGLIVPRNPEANSDTASAASPQNTPVPEPVTPRPPDGTPVTRSSSLPTNSALPASIALQLPQIQSAAKMSEQKAKSDHIFNGGVNGSLEFYYQGLDGLPYPEKLPLASAYIALNGNANDDGYKNFHQALKDIGINYRNAAQSAVYLVQPGMSQAEVLGDIKERLGKGFSQQLDKSPELQAYLADRVSQATSGQLINITDFWEAAIADTVRRAYEHEGGMYFRNVIDHGGTIPIASKMLGGFNFKSMVSQDDLAPQAYQDYALRSMGVDAAVLAASLFLPTKGLGPALRGEVSLLEGRVGFAGLAESITGMKLLAFPTKGQTFESLLIETRRLEKYTGPRLTGTLQNGMQRNTVPDLVRPGNASFLPGITDIKNVRVVSMDSQLQAQWSIAKSRNVPFNVVVSPTTEVYLSVVRRAQETGGNVYVWNPLTNGFRPYMP